jgi:hypothetical protein
VNPVPVIVAELIVSVEVPVELSVRDRVFDDPSVTLPKGRVIALSVSLGVAGAVPVPVSATTEALPVEELLLIVNCPVTAPAAVGANLIGSERVWPAASV